MEAGDASSVRSGCGYCSCKGCDNLDEQSVGRVALNKTQRVPQAADNREGAFGLKLNLHKDGLDVGHKVTQNLVDVFLAGGVDLSAFVEGRAVHAAALR